MSAHLKWRVFGGLAAVAMAGLIFGIIHKRNEDRRVIRTNSHAIGGELVSKGCSPRLDRLNPRLQARLVDFARKKARVADVLIGDEPAPLGDGNACSRLVLTNDAGQGLVLRLSPAAEPGMFHVLGYRNVAK
jgi:hypothetical protein